MDDIEKHSRPAPDRLTLILRWVVATVALLIFAGMGSLAYIYYTTPAALRHPLHAHYHFRLQVISGGTAVNFADEKFQTEFNKDICTANLTKEPVHFHDHLDQFVHIHWNHLTGGIVLKDYGWNFIGGLNDILGYRFDTIPNLVKVPIHGHDLPQAPTGANYYVYTGDETHYIKRDWKDFLNTDLETFFADKPAAASFWDQLIPTASAHSEAEETLAQLNDVLGSVVIFAQKTPPTDAQIKDRFQHLIALPESACAG